MGLYGDLPQAKSSAAQEDTTSISKQNSWTASSLAPPNRKPSSLFGAPPAVLRAGRGKPTSATQRQQAARRESNDQASTSTPTGLLQLCHSLAGRKHCGAPLSNSALTDSHYQRLGMQAMLTASSQ